MKISWTIVALAFAAQAGFGAPAALPRESVYQAEVALTNDRGERLAWREQRGQPQIVSMFYTSCKYTCPMLVDGAKAIQGSLTPDERARLRVTFITFDPARDSARTLAALRAQRDLDALQWTLMRPEPRDVRTLASLLGIRYRALADGDFNHTSALVLLDADGRIVARTERIGGVPDPAFVAAVRGQVQAVPAH